MAAMPMPASSELFEWASLASSRALRPARLPACSTNLAPCLCSPGPVVEARPQCWLQTAVQKPELADRPAVLLVLQNVSDKAIRFCDTQMKKNDNVSVKEDKRTLYLREANKGILFGVSNSGGFGVSSSGGSGTDVELQPR